MLCFGKGSQHNPQIPQRNSQIRICAPISYSFQLERFRCNSHSLPRKKKNHIVHVGLIFNTLLKYFSIICFIVVVVVVVDVFLIRLSISFLFLYHFYLRTLSSLYLVVAWLIRLSFHFIYNFYARFEITFAIYRARVEGEGTENELALDIVAYATES